MGNFSVESLTLLVPDYCMCLFWRRLHGRYTVQKMISLAVAAGSLLTTHADLFLTSAIRVASLVILESAQSALDGQFAVGVANTERVPRKSMLGR